MLDTFGAKTCLQKRGLIYIWCLQNGQKVRLAVYNNNIITKQSVNGKAVFDELDICPQCDPKVAFTEYELFWAIGHLVDMKAPKTEEELRVDQLPEGVILREGSRKTAGKSVSITRKPIPDIMPEDFFQRLELSPAAHQVPEVLAQ